MESEGFIGRHLCLLLSWGFHIFPFWLYNFIVFLESKSQNLVADIFSQLEQVVCFILMTNRF